MTYKFTTNQLPVDFITKWSSFDVLKSRESVITKRDKWYYKVGQIPYLFLIRRPLMTLILTSWQIKDQWIKGRRITDCILQTQSLDQPWILILFYFVNKPLWHHHELLVKVSFIMQSKGLNNPKVLITRGHFIVDFFRRSFHESFNFPIYLHMNSFKSFNHVSKFFIWPVVMWICYVKT